MDIFLASIHVMAWATYLGGALIMELVLRHTQTYMRPSQVAVVCQRAGRRYRWFGLASLAILGLTGGVMVLRLNDADLAARLSSPALSLHDPYGRTLVLLAVLWLVTAAIVIRLAFWAHPALHVRLRSDMSEDEMKRERGRVGVSIRRMDQLLRLELGVGLVALLVGASLHVGGIV